MLGISGRETIKKEVKDYAVEARNVSGVALKNLGKFWDVARNEATIKEMHAALRSILEEDKSVNSLVEKMLSEENKLPKDNTNPFMVDVLELAKKTPLQLLIIGRPKSGKSTLAKAIAIAYNLFYISI